MRNFTLKILPWIALLMVLVSCGGSNTGSNGNNPSGLPIYGSWALPPIQNQDGTSQTDKVTFANGTFSITTTCTGQAGPVTVTASTPAQFTATQIMVTQAAAPQSQPIPGSNAQCATGIGAGTYTYTVNGSSLNLSIQGGQSYQLTRAQ